MKKIVSLLALSALVVSMTGCNTLKYNDLDDPNTGKVWRVQVRGKMEVAPDAQELAKDFQASGRMRQFVADVHATPERVSRTRGAPYMLRTPGLMGQFIFGQAQVPDSVSSSDIQKGAIVDVMREKIIDYDKNQFNRVVRVVCRAGDDPCIDRIKKEGTLFSVVDAAPVPGDLKGLTYAHKVSQEEERQYLDSLK